MISEINELALGIDLGPVNSQLTFYNRQNSGPRTVSVVPGEENYQIATPAELFSLMEQRLEEGVALLADFYYNHPSAKLGVVGITGTKGKSSTAYYLKYIFDEYLAAKGQPASGVISSIETYDGVEKFESHLTTPEPLDLERHFANGVATGMRYLTMEVSSQALKYDRVKNVEFAAAVFLNIGMDHISPIEHPDFEDYKNAKHRLFVDYQAREMIYNADDDTSEFMRIGFGGHQTSYGIERAADYHGTALAQFRSETALGIDFLCEHSGSSTAVRVLSPGEFSASGEWA